MPHRTPLATLFPDFPFAVGADEFLRKVTSESIISQFRARRISMIRIAPLLSGGGIEIGCDNNFIISLRDVNTLLEKAQSLGHEIGHTFHFDIKEVPPRDYFDRVTISETLFNQIEDFCTEFSHYWLMANDKDDLMLRIANTEKLIDQFVYIHQPA